MRLFFLESTNKMAELKNILITGASGFIGGHVVRHFADSPVSLHCLIRPGSSTAFIADLPVNLVYGDITDLPGLEKSFAGMDAVIHTAAMARDWGAFDDFYRVNVEGTLNVLKAALKNGIRRLILTGSVSSYGEEDSRTLKDETSPYNPHYRYAFDRRLPSGMNHYRETKALSTSESISYAEENGMSLTILEPVWVYGENEKGSGFYEYLKTVSSGMFMMPGCRTNTHHVIYAGELARAYYLAYTAGLEGIHRIIIGNEMPENMQRIYSLFCREAGVRPPVNIPRPLVFPAAVAAEWLWTKLRRASPPLLTRSRVNMFYDSIGFDTRKAERLLSFRNRVPLEGGIRNTVQWYKSKKWL